jgi:hypothetical protein
MLDLPAFGPVEHNADPGEFVGIQKPLAPSLLEFAHMPAGIAAVRSYAPRFRQVEHLGQKGHHSIALVRRTPKIVLKRKNVRPR